MVGKKLKQQNESLMMRFGDQNDHKDWPLLGPKINYEFSNFFEIWGASQISCSRTELTSIVDIIEHAAENRDLLKLYGLTLTDIHELLEVSLLNSTTKSSDFMEVRPAPLGAIIKVWKLERNSVYMDQQHQKSTANL